MLSNTDNTVQGCRFHQQSRLLLLDSFAFVVTLTSAPLNAIPSRRETFGSDHASSATLLSTDETAELYDGSITAILDKLARVGTKTSGIRMVGLTLPNTIAVM